MSNQYFLTLAVLLCEVITLMGTAPKPHIVFVLVDDWGYSDVGFHNPAVITPNFDSLANTGVILDRHYTYKFCSPSRASFLSGRWPHHAHQWNAGATNEVGLNLKFTTLADKLKQAGYATHIIGKWHEGFFDPAYLPVNRGFDTSTGFLNGLADHYTQEVSCAVDSWMNEEPDPRNGTYDSYNYRNDLTEIIQNHNPNTALFIYLSLHNVHTPIEAPQEWLDLYPRRSACLQRRKMQAMVSVADDVTGHAVELLQEKGMWNNTLFIVSADNGGAPCRSSNYPLKGAKGTFFEGGIRATAFANGGFLPVNMHGKIATGFIHIADWYATFCGLAGADPSDSGDGIFPVDSLDVWPIISGKNNTSPHNEIVLGYDFENDGAIIVGDYKLVVGRQQQGARCNSLMWSPLDYPCSDGPNGDDCNPYCLYNIVDDPEERTELSTQEPAVLAQLLARYNSYSSEPRDMQDQGYHSNTELPVYTDACTYMADNGGYWRPWKNVVQE